MGSQLYPYGIWDRRNNGGPRDDQRDFEFAKLYKLPIKVVIDDPKNPLDAQKMKEAHIGEGVMVNSDKFNG